MATAAYNRGRSQFLKHSESGVESVGGKIEATHKIIDGDGDDDDDDHDGDDDDDGDHNTVQYRMVTNSSMPALVLLGLTDVDGDGR